MRLIKPSFFQVCPKIFKDDGRLIARTSIAGLIFSATLLYRRIVFHPGRKALQIQRRGFWFFTRKRTIKFSNIHAVVYGYEDLNPLTGSGWGSGDSLEIYSVGLELHNGEYVHLFRFVGEGRFVNNSEYFPDWMYWDEYLFDQAGSQDQDSRRFVDLLQKMIGVTVTPRRV